MVPLIGPRLTIAAALLLSAAPALAADAVDIDAPGDILLFALGVSGLLIGRRISRGRKRDDGNERG